MFKNFDWRHALALVACGIVLGIGQIPQVKSFDAVLYGVASPLFLYAGMALPQLGGAAKDAAKKVGAVVFVLLGLGAVSATSQTACTPAEQSQVAKIAPEAAGCVFAIVEDVTVAPDIAKTAAKCGVTAEDIYALVAALLAKQPADAGPDGAIGASPDRAHLQAWADAAKAAGAK